LLSHSAGDIPSPSDGSIVDIDDTSENEAPLSGTHSKNNEIGFSSVVRSQGSPTINDSLGSRELLSLYGQEEADPRRRVVEATPDYSEVESETGLGNMYEDVGTEDWDFILPTIEAQGILNDGLDEADCSLNVEDLVGALQHGATLDMIRNYLERFDSDTVRRNINNDIEGFPAMFYVVESNNEPILRLWVANGGDPKAAIKRSNIPLLAFAIINSERIQEDTTLITTTLLGLGAVPDVIPAEFYTPYLRDLPENGPESKEEVYGTEQSRHSIKWCTGAARTKLAKSVTLSQRYYLEKASKTKKPSQRHVQLAQRRNAEALLGLPNFLIGQSLASNLLLQRLLSHLMVPSKRPLVLVFAGPSGHGKTELARKLGHLLSLELEVVDCTIFNREMELFGPREPYVGSEKGSPLNNFLANNSGKRCIVFLDEFEKTTSDIHKSLLLPFDNGRIKLRFDFETISESSASR
jgi:hypothetical protein